MKGQEILRPEQESLIYIYSEFPEEYNIEWRQGNIQRNNGCLSTPILCIDNKITDAEAL